MKKICFVIMGYGRRTDYSAQKTFDLDKTYLNMIKPTVENCGYECVRGDEVSESAIIDKSMYALLIHADLVIADITTHNPNALYELGMRHAAKPYSTIIMNVNGNPIPFDLNHNKIFHYTHLGDDIGVSEANRCQEELTQLIHSVEKSKETDSPLFHHIRSLHPHSLHEDEYISLIKELAEKDKHIFALVEQAKAEMLSNEFEKATKFWKKAHNKVEGEPYFIQQLALCTYKSKHPSERIALTKALGIITPLNPEDNPTNDPETLGITGAIYKRLWLLDKEIGYLNHAIDYYGRGYKVVSDYYTGENYALCLDYKAEIENDEDEKIYFTIEAKKTRKSIIKIIETILGEENYEQRNDIKWVYATMANCKLALGYPDEFNEYKSLFYQKAEASWEIETFEKSIEHINRINNE